MTGPGAARLLRQPLRQPDQRSCGAAVVVVAEALRDDAYAGWLADGGLDRFAAAVLDTHRRATGGLDPGGRLQVPWPRALGTPPWAVARRLGVGRGRPHTVRPVPPWARAEALAGLREDARHDPVPLYVGSRLLPRHVVLVLDADLTTYDPARGGTRVLDAEGFAAGRMRALRWPVPWARVSPR